jgi:hypothetical protein
MPAGVSGKTSRKGVSSKRPNKGSRKGAGAGKTASKGLAREPIQIVKREGENMVVDDLGNVIRPLDEDDAMGEDGQDLANETVDLGEADETPDENRLRAQQEAQVEAELVDKLAAGVSVDADMDSVAGLPHVHMDEIEYNEDWDEMHFVSISKLVYVLGNAYVCLCYRKSCRQDLQKRSSLTITFDFPSYLPPNHHLKALSS